MACGVKKEKQDRRSLCVTGFALGCVFFFETVVRRTPGVYDTYVRACIEPGTPSTAVRLLFCTFSPPRDCSAHRLPTDLGSLKSRVHIQVCHDNLAGVNKLLEVGGSIDIRDSAQRTLLHRACEEVIFLSWLFPFTAPPSHRGDIDKDDSCTCTLTLLLSCTPPGVPCIATEAQGLSRLPTSGTSKNVNFGMPIVTIEV